MNLDLPHPALKESKMTRQILDKKIGTVCEFIV